MAEQLLINGFASSCSLAMLAAGMTFVYQTTRVFHIAQAATFLAASYLLYYFVVLVHMPLWGGVVAALLATIVLGLSMELFVYGPLEKRRAPTVITLVASIGLFVFCRNAIAAIPAFGNDTKIILEGVQPTFQLGNSALTVMQVVQVGVALILLPLMLLWISRSGTGRLIRAVADNPTLAQAQGIDLRSARLIAIALSSALAGITSMIIALDTGTDPGSGMPYVVAALTAMIIGGTSIPGALAGAFLLSISQALVAWRYQLQWTEAVSFMFLFATLIIRPQGLLALRKRREEMR